MSEIRITTDNRGGSFEHTDRRPEAPTVPRSIYTLIPSFRRNRPDTPRVSRDGKKITHDLPGGGRVVARHKVIPNAALIDGEWVPYEQVTVTRTGPDGSRSGPEIPFKRSNRPIKELEDDPDENHFHRYPKGFFRKENFPGTVVEVATGGGALVEALQDMKVDARGVDVWLSKKQRKKRYFSLGLAEHTGLPDEIADHVILNNMLFYDAIRNRDVAPGEYERSVVAEAGRILRPGGQFFVFPVQQHDRWYYTMMAGGQPLYVPDLSFGTNNRAAFRGPLLFHKATEEQAGLVRTSVLKPQAGDPRVLAESRNYFADIMATRTGEPVGTIGIDRQDPTQPDVGTVSYVVEDQHQGNNYATGAVGEMAEIAFGLGLQRVEGKTAVDNHASRRVLEKNGFQVIEGRSTNSHVLYARDKAA